MTSELKVSASFFCTKVPFIGTVTTVVFTVALPSIGNAATIVTSQLTGFAGHIGTALLICNIEKKYD
jgi:hypothetical protein